MRQQTYPPAWYPDPGNPSRLRRWDGWAWTRDTRVPPGWVSSVPLAPGPGGSPKRRTSRWLWALSGSVVVLAAVLMALLARLDARAVERISDAQFARRAHTLCLDTRRETVEANRPTGASGPTEGRRLAALAGGLEEMVAGIRAVPVAAGDRPAVERWVGALDRYIAQGRRRADALQRGDAGEAERAAQEAVGPRRAANRFAGANGLTACLF